MSEGTGNAGEGQGSTGESKAITFASPEELQEHIDKTLSKRFAEINTKAEAKTQASNAVLMTEIEELKTKVSEGKGKGSEKNVENADLTAVRTELAALKAKDENSRLRSAKAVITSAASGLGAINGEQVAQLVFPNVKIGDDDTLTILNGAGDVIYGADGKIMDIKEYLTGFFNENKHLIKPSGGTGAGSQGSNSMGGVDDKTLSSMPPAERLTAFRASQTLK